MFPSFKKMEDLNVPWRWRGEGSNSELGRWLIETARPALENGQRLSFQGLEDRGVYWHPLPLSFSSDLQTLANQHDKIFVICNPKNPNKPHSIAEGLHNRYRTIEPLIWPNVRKFSRSYLMKFRAVMNTHRFVSFTYILEIIIRSQHVRDGNCGAR